MSCENCNNLFEGEFLGINIGDLEYGVQFQSLESGPSPGQTSVHYNVCNCNTPGGGGGISFIVFELCDENAPIPIRVKVTDEHGNTVNAIIEDEGDNRFSFPNFKVENFGDVNAEECKLFTLIYNQEFDEEFLGEGQFGVKIGAPMSEPDTGVVSGLPIPGCANGELVCDNACQELCDEAGPGTMTFEPCEPELDLPSCVRPESDMELIDYCIEVSPESIEKGVCQAPAKVQVCTGQTLECCVDVKFLRFTEVTVNFVFGQKASVNGCLESDTNIVIPCTVPISFLNQVCFYCSDVNLQDIIESVVTDPCQLIEVIENKTEGTFSVNFVCPEE